MDTLQLYQLLARADAAGDTQAAQAVADYIRTLPGAPKPPTPQGGSDFATSFKLGAVGSAKALTDFAGADNAVSKSLGETSEGLQKQYSPARKAEMQMQDERMRKAEASGSTWEELKAGTKSVAEAPLQFLAQGLGSMTPYIPAMLLGPIGAAAGLGARSLAALRVVANAAPTVMGTAQGAGALKGSIYDATLKAEMADGVPETQARAKASVAQETFGKNMDQILLAGGVGAVAGRTGTERLLTPAGRAAGAVGTGRRVAGAMGVESITEGGQGFHERVGTNVALQRQGRDVPTFQGAAGAFAQEGLTGGLTAGPIALVRGPGATPEAPPKAQPDGTPGAPAGPATPVADLPENVLIGVQQELRKLVDAGDTSAGVVGRLAEVTQELRDRGVADTAARTEALTANRLASETEQENDRLTTDTEAFRGDTTNMEQVGFRAMEPEGVITGTPPAAPVEAQIGLADVISDAGLPGTTEDLRTAGIVPPTNKELEAAGQMPLGLRRTPTGEPTTTAPPTPPADPTTPYTFTAQDLKDINIPMKSAKVWLTENVVGKTQEQVQALVNATPALLTTPGPRAKILGTLLQRDPPAYKEAENVIPTPTEPATEPAGREPSVGVPSQPAGDGPGAGLVSRPEATGQLVPAEPLGLEPAGDDVVTGDAPEGVLAGPVADLIPEPTIRARKKPKVEVPSAWDWRGPSLTGDTTKGEIADEKAALASARRYTKKSSIGISTGRTVGDLTAELAQDTSRVGRAVQNLIKTGKLKLETKSATENEAGSFDGRTATLYADAINEGTAMSVLLHEIGAHMGLEAMLGTTNYKSLPGRIRAMAAGTKASAERMLARAAMDRVPEGAGTDVDSELTAYFIEEIARAATDGTLPKSGPISVIWRQVKAAFLSAVNRTLGTQFGLNDISVRDMLAMAEAVAIRESGSGPTGVAGVSQSSVATVKEITAKQTALAETYQTTTRPTATNVRTQITDSMATVAEHLNKVFKGAVRVDGKVNPLAAMRQAADSSKMVAQWMLWGGFRNDAVTKQFEVFNDPNTPPPEEVFRVLEQYAKAEGMELLDAKREASMVLEGWRLNGMRTSNETMGTDFALHLELPEIDTLVAKYKSSPLLQQMSALLDAPRIKLVTEMERVGRITPETAQAWREVVGYVPFDRVQGVDENFSRMKKPTGRGIGQYGKIPVLKGAIERPVGDVFDNYTNTIAWMIRQITATNATRSALEQLATMDIGFKKLPGDSTTAKAASTTGIIQEVWVKGEPVYYELPTKYDKMAFADPTPPPTGMVKYASQISKVLRTSITALPPFALKQVIDDVQRAVLNSGVKNPAALIGMSLRNFFSIIFSELRGKQHPLMAKFAAKGITGEVDSNHLDATKYLMESMGLKKRGLARGLMHKLDAITRASDLAVRAAVHEQTLIETGDMLLADTRARELINFRRKGAAQGVSTMIATIPFFNAYLQGTDLVYRNAMGTDSSMGVSKVAARKMFATRAAQVFAFSLAYAFMKQDDDDYKNMDLRTRNNNWIIGDGIKISAPSEMAALFKVTAENLVEYYSRHGTPEELTANDAVMNAMANIFEQFAGRITPIPQAVKPIFEAWANYSTFTGRAIEGLHIEGLDKDQRKTMATSEFAIAIADFTKTITDGKVLVSPLMIDNTLNGYFGSSAALVKLLTDGVLNPDRADKPIEKWAMLSNFMYETGPTAGSRRTDEFYTLADKLSSATNTMTKLAQTDSAAAEAYGEKHAGQISLNRSVQRTIDSLGKMRKSINFLESKNGVEAMPDKAERAEAVKELKAAQRESVLWLREIKQEMGL